MRGLISYYFHLERLMAYRYPSSDVYTIYYADSEEGDLTLIGNVDLHRRAFHESLERARQLILRRIDEREAIRRERDATQGG